MESPSTGYVNLTVSNQQGRQPLYAPFDSFIMISVMAFETRCPFNGLAVYTIDQSNTELLLWRVCDSRYSDTYVLEASNVTLHWELPLSGCYDPTCITLYFSFHSKSKIPRKLSSGLYNCSGDDYWKFHQHLNCNLRVECEDGRDETGQCPFSSPACKGWVAVGNKCYTYVRPNLFSNTTHDQANAKHANLCASLNATVGSFRNGDDLKTVIRIILDNMPTSMKWIQITAFLNFYYGQLSVPNVYRRNLVAYDKTVIHHSLSASARFHGTKLCFIVPVRLNFPDYRIFSFRCSRNVLSYLKTEYYATCEFSIHGNQRHEIAGFPKVKFTFGTGNSNFSRCQDGHVVHQFLSYSPHYACGDILPHFLTSTDRPVASRDSSQRRDQLLTSKPVFTCSNAITRLSYTLVCDFRHHCEDGSDETFCRHPPCATFACNNGQCISYSKRCDVVSDCLDDSDESTCKEYTFRKDQFWETRSPAIITFDGRYSFDVKAMNSSEICPQTHYRCPGEYNDCLPVYTQCNGWYDCQDHEDEEACENMTCSGFYRCFNSTVCVHADHLCDGWPHCPQHDDEWLCNMTCPAQCLCQGHTFFCSRRFSAHLFPELRCLDAQGSGMTPSDMYNQNYLVHLSLANCSLNYLPVMTFLNLQYFDLSANSLSTVSMAVFAHLKNLRTLSLAKNLIDLIHYDPNVSVHLANVKTVDLSHNKLSVFDSKALSSLMYVQRLNLSFCTIHTIHRNGFQYTPKLTHLYLAGNPIKLFSADMFKPLSILHTVTSETYELCCRELLPTHFESISCESPTDEISSCEDLLQSDMYRGFLWLISILSLLGNAFCLLVRVCAKKTASSSGFNVFVTNLSCADLLMGVYIAIIGVVDSVFRGDYLFYDETWKHSVVCKVAGFLSLLSSEVSALTIWLITLDRFIALHFPFGRVRFQRTSAAVTCLITWLVGLFIAAIPLMPMSSHWHFFSQTAICIPLPITRQDFKGKTFSVSVFIVFNFALFLLISTGQAFIYWSVRKNALNTCSTKVSQDLTIAKRLISVAVTDFMCWFPICLCGLLALADIPISGEVNVAFAIFVLPLNSALNPFMYTYNMLVERRKKFKESMLLQLLESCPDLL